MITNGSREDRWENHGTQQSLITCKMTFLPKLFPSILSIIKHTFIGKNISCSNQQFIIEVDICICLSFSQSYLEKKCTPFIFNILFFFFLFSLLGGSLPLDIAEEIRQ